eukprot:CAMPEP_0178416930 /NCGR_PEP_ID=MMETSP0689_2-20121128/24316_1 /TAXON_ID=160604 /ORGANISM="Amphidinium massartii, Strain CS-259" /LENGTH=248 /DNA_ID=CAMNT_0020038287 /DNA_START=1132 /DNA_END=1880 /DNA_ORIENTATION=-
MDACDIQVADNLPSAGVHFPALVCDRHHHSQQLPCINLMLRVRLQGADFHFQLLDERLPPRLVLVGIIVFGTWVSLSPPLSWGSVYFATSNTAFSASIGPPDAVSKKMATNTALFMATRPDSVTSKPEVAPNLGASKHIASDAATAAAANRPDGRRSPVPFKLLSLQPAETPLILPFSVYKSSVDYAVLACMRFESSNWRASWLWVCRSWPPMRQWLQTALQESHGLESPGSPQNTASFLVVAQLGEA